MNEYNDPHLDTKGVEQLGRIIALHSSHPDGAMAVLDQLIAAYPKSAQLWVSKGIFTKTKNIQDRKRCFQKAAEVNENFYDAYRRWASCARIGACIFYTGSPKDRNEFMAGIVGFARTPETSQVLYAKTHPELFMEDWKEQYTASLGIMRKGLQVADRSLWTEEEFGKFDHEYLSLSTLDDDGKKFFVLMEWVKNNK